MEELRADLGLEEIITRAVSVLPGAKMIPDPTTPGGAKKTPSAEVVAFLRMDFDSGFSPFDAPPWWREVRNPSDVSRRGVGTCGVRRAVAVGPLRAYLEGGAPRREPWGGLTFGFDSRRRVAGQAVSAYSAVLRIAEEDGGGGGLNLPGMG